MRTLLRSVLILALLAPAALAVEADEPSWWLGRAEALYLRSLPALGRGDRMALGQGW
jgi:hypothetical protein